MTAPASVGKTALSSRSFLIFLEMAIHVNVSSTVCQASEKCEPKLHLMPCLIKADDEAKVSTYFEPIISKVEADILSSSFRGYPLLGKELELPKTYRGVVLQESHDNLDEKAERNIYAIHTFKKFTYWNWDKPPSANDKIISALDWIEISHALHSPIEI